MGNCFGALVNHHHSPEETSRNNNKQTEGTPLPRSNSNAALNGNVEERSQAAGKVITPNLKLFKSAELKSATQNFRADTFLGDTEFGRVFKGWVDETTYAPSEVGVGIAIAVKRIDYPYDDANPQWLQEYAADQAKLFHPNLVKLLGYCCEDQERLLVYEHMQKGSLENYLFRKRSPEPLPWNTRLKIAIGAARGLSFLHTSEKPIIYCDFKSANILLDVDYNAKLSYFGLRNYMFGPTNANEGSHMPNLVMGTYCYAAPEFVETGHMYIESDVYSFGVVFLEMITGLRAHDRNRTSDSRNLVLYAKPSLSNKKKLKKIMDSRLGELYPLKGACQAAQLILRCLESDPKNRPSMEQVLEELENINAIKMTTEMRQKQVPSGFWWCNF